MAAITNAAYADRLADLTDAFVNGTAAGDVEALALGLLDLVNDWTLEGLSLPQLATQFADRLGKWDLFLEGMVDWFTLPADGGPSGDGEISVLSYTGVLYTIPVLAKIQDVVVAAGDLEALAAAVAAAEASATAAAGSVTTAAGSATAADVSADAASASATAAAGSATTAAGHVTTAAGSASAAAGSAGDAAASAAAALASEAAAELAETNAETAQTASEAARDLAEQYRDEAEEFRDQASAIVGGDFQAHDAMLDSLVTKTWTAGRQVLYLSAADTVALADVGAAAGGNLLDRDAGDGRYRQQATALFASEVLFEAVTGTGTGFDPTTVEEAVLDLLGMLEALAGSLDQVDNTSDLDKPISNAVQAALDSVSGISELASDMLRVFISLSELRANQFGAAYGRADDFADTDGVDALASTGESYSSALKLYQSAAGETSVQNMTGPSSPAGNVAAASSQWAGGGDYPAWDAFDGGAAGGDPGANGWFSANATVPQWISRRWTAAPKMWTTYTITSFANPNSAKAWTLQGSNNNSDWTTLDTRSGVTWPGGPQTFTIASPGAFEYYRIYITEVTGPSAVGVGFVEITFETAPSALDLRSVAQDAVDVPSKSWLAIMLSASTPFTLGTDLVAYVTRDGGDTWVEAPLVAREAAGTFRLYETAEPALLEDCAADVDMRWRVTGSAGVTWRISAVAQRWDSGGGT